MEEQQLELWKLEVLVKKGYMLNKHLLQPGERPDCRPWGGIFDKKA